MPAFDRLRQAQDTQVLPPASPLEVVTLAISLELASLRLEHCVAHVVCSQLEGRQALAMIFHREPYLVKLGFQLAKKGFEVGS